MAPFVPSVAAFNEHLRFVSMAQATITFTIWNFLLVPVFLSAIKKPAARKGFIKLCTSFILIQLHCFNLIFAALNGVWGTPAREFTKVDFCVALLFMLEYVLFYLFYLDRIGVHHYFIFSPRTPIALLMWSVLVACHYGTFSWWKEIVLNYGGLVDLP
jgi:hypothetical protein